MPFKLKLKKSRHYSVASKSLFVISVEMLDGTNVECTLSSESTGQDCLDVVCQKLGLNQPKFFGLQYMSKNSENGLYWLELDRPIKRQLDKYTRSLNVYLKVMYYIISGVRLLNDESFTDPSLLESLTDAASRQHAALHNLPQGTAEEYYICACQQLEGYGQEIYAVKDRLGDDAIISVSLTEVSVGYAGEREGRHYGWADIKNVINHKRDFTIETIDSEKVEFQFVDVESAKNAWRYCVLQHTFYRQYEMNNDQADKGPPAPPVFQQAQLEEKLRQMDSYEDITDPSHHWDRSVSTQSLKQRAQSTSCLDLNKPTNIDQLRSLLPSYRPAPDYETAMQHKYRNSSGAIPSREPLRNTHTILYSSQPEIHQSDTYSTHLRYPDVTHNNIEPKNIMTSMYNAGFTQSQILSNENQHNFTENVGLLHLYKPPPPYPSNRISSNSTPDLAGISQQAKPQSHFINNIVSGSSPDLVSGGNLYLKHYSQALYPNHQAHPVHRSHSYLPPQHGTYENLSSIFNNNMLGRPQAVIVENPNITKHIKKVYDEHGNIIYCMPANMKQILQENQLPSTGFVVTRNQNAMVAHDPHLNNSTEPIYENIPLPWQNDNGEIRARTQSIHSAPEISQVINHTVVNALQSQFQNVSIGTQGSKETLYANINRNNSSAKSSKTDLNVQDVTDLNSLSRSNQNLTDSPITTSSNNTFIVNKNPVMNSTGVSGALFSESSNATNESQDTSSTSGSSNKSKKKRWGILIGRSKSSEKVKSATLGREKEKKDKNHSNNKHRWSTGLPRFNPLPPSISKETMRNVSK
ncbi:tyrosine-protein phosphatase non-receptor type 21 [Asbolus verrucosus]|uniref:protein-tyrosine-phosphatase n=1 Tax=Asbolus verrucosus TaxID=1661398 RepID=A0A482W766_ASBVE|nr:tyrosine-protein phosphatase non-receptor type 21 [Asbolus verrucosus]